MVPPPCPCGSPTHHHDSSSSPLKGNVSSAAGPDASSFRHDAVGAGEADEITVVRSGLDRSPSADSIGSGLGITFPSGLLHHAPTLLDDSSTPRQPSSRNQANSSPSAPLNGSLVSRSGSLDVSSSPPFLSRTRGLSPSLRNYSPTNSLTGDGETTASATPFLRYGDHSHPPYDLSGRDMEYLADAQHTVKDPPTYPPIRSTSMPLHFRDRDRKEPHFRKALRILKRHGRFVGPGLVSSVAYFDPGNWTVDLSAGSEFGYKLLFVILMAGLGAAVLQVLALRLGITTSTSLPRQIRLLFLRWRDRFGPPSRNDPKTTWMRRLITVGLYANWALAELAIIGTDLAELLGSAIALNLLIPQIPLYAGVLITAADVFIVLIFFQSGDSGRKGMLLFELLIVSLVLCVFASFIVLLVQIKPDWVDAFKGFLPSKTLVKPSALYTSIGIIGSTIMPHGLILGSHLATIDRLDLAPKPPVIPSVSFFQRHVNLPAQESLPAILPERWRSPTTSMHPFTPHIRSTPKPAAQPPHLEEEPHQDLDETASEIEESRMDRIEVILNDREELAAIEQSRYEEELRVFDKVRFVTLHIAHASVDTLLSLLGFAVTINSAILILASAAFYYGSISDEEKAAAVDADLFSAHDLIEAHVGKPAAFVFALALLCSGQSASITATLSGQVVSEGYLEWRTSPLARRLVTRLLGIVPSVAVAIAVGRSGINTMLVASQVMLSIVLPFVILPLVWLCSNDDVMTVENGANAEVQGLREADSAAEIGADDRTMKRSFKSHWSVTGIGYAILAVVVVANSYVLVELMMGNS